MAEIYGEEKRNEITSLLELGRAISPNSQEIAKPSRLNGAEGNERLACMRVLNDYGAGNRILSRILNGTPQGESIKKYLGIVDKEEDDKGPIVDTEPKLPSSEHDRRAIALHDDNGTYKIVRLENLEIDEVNAEDGDKGFSVDKKTAEELNELIDIQREAYETNLEELVRKTW